MTTATGGGHRHRRTRAAMSVAVVVGILMVSVLPAAAHVDVEPADGAPVEPGDDAILTVRVPNEREVGTVGVELVFPEVFETVSVVPTTGWTVEAEHEGVKGTSSVSGVPIVPVHDGEEHPETTTPPSSAPTDTGSSSLPAPGPPETFENVSALVWTGGPTGPDEIVEFVITVGPVPDTPTLVFKAVQIYESGEEVRWIQEPTDDGTRLEFPASVLQVEGATPDNLAEEGPLTEERSENGSDDATDDSSEWWKPVLVGLAVLLIVGGVTARVITQRRMSHSAPDDTNGPLS
ncbi:MAG: YcnI family protein [Acidimicrobiia bacterium]|nr:YcnI family protein [Acidimicrobiia bacterium]